MASELQGLQNQLTIQTERLNALRKDLAILSDANQKFTVELQIKELEASNEALKKRIQSGGYGITMVDANDLLKERIRALKIDVEESLGEIYLVNCDRKPQVNNFWNAFEGYNQRHHPFQFYFVVACPSQQPASFAERMIYEILIEELEEASSAINYVHPSNSNRVKVEDLPLGRNLQNSQREFKKYFARRFGMSNPEASFEDYIRTGLPRLDYQYVSTVFDLNASDWDEQLMQNYLQWIMDVFANTPEEMPTFLFFFVLFLKDAHVEPLTAQCEKITNHIQSIIQKNETRCTLISQLTPVPSDLVANWIRKLGEQNDTKIDNLIRLLVADLPPDKKAKYEATKTLDMSDIELFQEVVCKVIME